MFSAALLHEYASCMPACSPCCPERLMLTEPSSDDTLTTVRVRFFLRQSRSMLASF